MSANRQVRLEVWPPQRVAYLRHNGPYETSGQTFDRFLKWVEEAHLFGPETRCLGICWDDPEETPPEKIRFDCCITIESDFHPGGDIRVQTIPGGEFAVLTHKGHYETLQQSYDWLYNVWLPQSGREARDDPPFEVYYNSPANTSPENLLTDIFVPLK